MDGPVAAELGDAEEVLVERPDRHGVDLDGLETLLKGGVDAAQHVVNRAHTRDGGELGRVEGVERDVDAADAGGTQVMGKAGKKRAVGGDGDVLDAIDRHKARGQLGASLARKRLTPREAQVANAIASRNGDEALDLLEAHDLAVALVGYARGGHAIDAAVVAPVGDGNPHVIYRAPAGVFVRQLMGDMVERRVLH